MPRWLKVVIVAALPSMAGVVAWWICVANGLGLDATSIVVGLVVLLPATPLAIWAGQAVSRTGPPPAPKGDAPHVPAVVGEVPREPKAFQPRSDLSECVDEVLSARHAAAVCALAGGRGVGKTHLAAAYARRCIDKGLPVAWLHAETVEKLHGSVDQMAAELGLRSDADDAAAVARKVRAWLEERREPYLVVLDNATDPDLLVPLLPSHGRARVLITTNDHSFERLATLVTVEEFTADEAVSYLSSRVGGRDGDSFRPLADELDRLPLALAIAAAALVGPPRLSCDSYLERLHATPIELLLARPRGEPYPRGVAQAIMLSVGEAGPASAHLLGELSVLSSSGVRLDLLDPLAEAAVAELGARSLITFSRDDTTAFVHRLVRRAVRDQAERDRTLAEMIDSAARRLLVGVEEVTDQDTWRKFPTIMAVADHATALWEALEQFPDDESAQIRAAAEVVLRVREVVANHLLYLNDQVRAFPIAEAVVAGREKLFGAEHPDTLIALHNLAHAAEVGSMRSIALYQHVAAARARTLGDDHPEAVRMYEHVAEGQARVLGADHPDTLITRHGLAAAYEAVGRTADAIAEYELAANRFEAVMGPEQTLTKTARDNLERVRRSLQRR